MYHDFSLTVILNTLHKNTIPSYESGHIRK